MKRLLVGALLVAIAGSASAGGNPDVRIYVDFDPPNYVHEFTPDLYTITEAHICMDMIGEGLSSVSFRMEDPLSVCPGTMAPPSFTYLIGLPP